jgi:uncharacterized protein YigA (DUF484 family)
MNDDDVARFLKDNPAFFQRHPALLLDLQLPDPHHGSAVSLMERQTLMLRDRVKGLEARLAELIQIGRANDRLARDLIDWTRALLAEPDRAQLRALAATELKRAFAVPLVEIRTWTQPPGGADAAAAHAVSAMVAPNCGAGIDLAAFGGLDEEWKGTRSVALIPLRRPGQGYAFGFIALGSSDPGRFDATLGTAVLTRIGELASAALAPAGL